jgi:hypothetical protein
MKNESKNESEPTSEKGACHCFVTFTSGALLAILRPSLRLFVLFGY